MPETLETLSLPHQTLDAEYFHRVLHFTDKAVIAAPCGWGKTLGIAAYIAQNYRNGVLYVAERVQQLEDMHDLLSKTHQVPAEDIAVYYAQSADMKQLYDMDVTKPIALITHSRMQSHAPSKYVTFPGNGVTQKRQLLIVDEALPPLVIMSAPDFFIDAFLRRMGLEWQELGQLSPAETDTRINRVQAEIVRYARCPFQKAGVDYLDWTNHLKETEMSQSIRAHAYYVMLYHVLQGQYIHDGKINVLIPMAPHLSWIRLFDQILILDATAALCDYLYTDYPILTPGTWNYADIQLPLKYYSSLGNLSRTKLANYQELFLQELSDHIVPALLDQGFADPYVVTYKNLKQASFVEQVSAVFGGTPVQSYGGTRGSNAFREKDSVVLVGSYRPPVEFDALATKLFGAAYHHYKYACAHWIQEVYRTRIRQHQGESIQLLTIGQREILDSFEQLLGRFLHPISIGAHEQPALFEQILRGHMHTLQRTLLAEVTKKRRVNIKAFADQQTNRDQRKVRNAYHGLLKAHPRLQGHLVIDGQGEWIQLVAIPCPI
jgi:hypothetical protein